MSVIRFLFWLISVVIVAYFMTDIKVGGKSLKENIDEFIASPAGANLKGKATHWVESKLGSLEGDLPTKVIEAPAPSPAPTLPKEEITQKDENELQKILKKNTNN